MWQMSILTSLALATSSCQHPDFRYLARRVSADELVGAWAITEAAQKDLKSIGYTKHLGLNDHALVIHPAGSCSYQGWVEPSRLSENEGDFVSTECRWTLKDIQYQAIVVELPKQNRNLISYFAEEEERLLLWKYLGDPDSAKYFEFSRQR